MTYSSASMQCKLKGKCPRQSDALYNCWDDECNGWMHLHCSNMLLTKFDIPVADRPDDSSKTDTGEPIVFCKKGCFLKWQAAKKREAKALATGKPFKKKKVPWEDDGTMDVLLDWLTTEGHYADYCGATGNKGKSKTQYHKELSLLIKEKIPESERTEKDVENKITSLERQFRTATDWANNTGQGVDNPGDFKAAVLKRCPFYDELEPIMGDRPNAKPLSTNELDSDDDLSKGSNDSDLPAAATAVQESMNNDEDNAKTPAKQHLSSVSSVSSKSTSSSKRRLKASTSRKNKKPKGNSVDDLLAGYLGTDDEDDVDVDNSTSFKQLRIREVQAKEREANARWLEAEAISGKAKSESVILDIQAKANLLREKKKLLEEGIDQNDIDELLPLKKPSSS
jgi:hypothetical protein